MRLVLCWAPLAGYAAACWHALAARKDIELRVIAFEGGRANFSNDLVRGLECRLLDEKEQHDEGLIQSLVRQWKPDVLYTSGWFHPPYQRLMALPELRSVPKWIGVDTPWVGTLRQHVGRLALRRYVARADRVIVPGERSWQYMRRLGVPEARIRRGLYGVDHASLSPLYEQRLQEPGGWPRRFLYVGRYAEEKGMDCLLAAYEGYRSQVSDPWPLGCCGGGPLEPMLSGRAGVENHGFKQPAELIEIMRRYGVFVLASTFDPWPLVVVEASAAGVPVVCTEACGSSVELVRSYYNGVTVATGDAAALTRAMLWMHHHHADLPEMGRRGRELAAAYSAQAWADRWEQLLRESARS